MADTILQTLEDAYNQLTLVLSALNSGTNPQIRLLVNGVTAKGGTNDKLDCSNETLAKVHMALHGPNSVYERLGEMKTLISERNKQTDQYLRTIYRIETSLNKANTTLSSILNIISTQTCDAQNELASNLKQLYEEIHQMHMRLIPIEVVVGHLEGMRESVATIAQERRNQAESRSIRPHHQKKD